MAETTTIPVGLATAPMNFAQRDFGKAGGGSDIAAGATAGVGEGGRGGGGFADFGDSGGLAAMDVASHF